MKNTDQESEWSRARGLLADLESATRRSLSAQILLGKELLLLKKKLGFEGSGRRPKEKTARAVFVRTWQQWCLAELKISADTANRYIACFDYALSRAKARKKTEPEALMLLQADSESLSTEQLDLLSDCVHRLIQTTNEDGSPVTQRQILEELGIVKPAPVVGGDTSQFKKTAPDWTAQEWAENTFQNIPREFDKLEREIFRVKGAPDYRLLLLELPIDSPEDGKASLMGIKECLERVLTGGVAEILTDVEAAIEAKMHDTPPKRTRRKSLTLAKK